MRLTDHTDYSLRVLMYLNQTKDLATLKDLSKSLGISRNNLIKVSAQLSDLGLVEATRGASGGLKIKATTGKKTLKEIVGQTEQQFRMAECFVNKNSTCTFVHSCKLKTTLKGALNAFLDTLADTTVDDITPPRPL